VRAPEDEKLEERTGPAMTKANLGIVFVVTLLYFFVEMAGGLYFNSLALVTDASFMAVNLAGQLLAIYTSRLGERPPDKQKTFGYERAKVLSGMFNGMAVGFVLFYVLIDAIKRIAAPEPLDAGKVFYIAVLGLLVNAFGVWKLYSQSKEINIRGAFLLILNDLLGSVGVIVSSVIIRFTGYYVVDAFTSIIMGLFILYPTVCLVKGSIDILMEGIPAGIDVETVTNCIEENFSNGVMVKDLHVWQLVPQKVFMAVKIRTNHEVWRREEIKELKKILKKRFGFHDIFIEIYEDR
jgi:cobalt-zinc-cadmium efflux system protein